LQQSFAVSILTYSIYNERSCDLKARV